MTLNDQPRTNVSDYRMGGLTSVSAAFGSHEEQLRNRLP